MNSRHKKVLASLEKNKNELIATTRELIAFPSLFGQEETAQHYYAGKLRAIGGAVEVWEPDIDQLRRHPAYVSSRESFAGSPVVVGAFRGSGGGRSMFLCGHMDVVPPGAGRWTVDPWGGILQDGRIYGRGAADMKGGLAANYIAVKSIVDSGLKLKGDVLVGTTVDEECGSTGALAIAVRGYRADGCIIPEPTGLEMNVASTGSVWFRVSVPGKSAHAGMSYKGVNSIYKAMLIIGRLRELEEARRIRLMHPLYANHPIPFCLNVNTIKAGNWPAIVPAETVFEGRMGVSPVESIEEARKELEDTIGAVAASDIWLRDNPPVIEYLDCRWNSGMVEPEHPLCRLLQDKIAAVTGKPAQITGMGPCSDSGTFIRYAATPAVNFGPNAMTIAHQTDEYVDVESLYSTAQIIALALLDWCGAE